MVQFPQLHTFNYGHLSLRLRCRFVQFAYAFVWQQLTQHIANIAMLELKFFFIFYALCVCVSVNCVFGFDAFFVMFCVGVLLFCWWFCVLFAVCICRFSVMMLCCLLCAVGGNCLLLQLVCSV